MYPNPGVIILMSFYPHVIKTNSGFQFKLGFAAKKLHLSPKSFS